MDFTKGTKACKLWDPEKKYPFVSRDVVFDGELMFQENSKTKDKRKIEFQIVQLILRAKSLSFQMAPTSLSSQMKTSQIQIERGRKLIKSNMCNLDR